MQACSNCGAAARPGAKFCTSCGARLPIVPAAENRGWGDHGDQSQQPSPWNSAPVNGHQATDAPEPTTVSASAAGDQPAASGDAAAANGSNSSWGRASDDAHTGTSDAGETATADASPAPSSSSWSWGQPQTDETASAQDDLSATSSNDGQPATSDDEASATTLDAEPNWIASWSGQTAERGGEAAVDNQEAGAYTAEPPPAAPSPDEDDQPATSSDDTAGWTFPATSAADGGGAGANDTATAANDQDGTETADANAQPEWMRNLAATQANTNDNVAAPADDAATGHDMGADAVDGVTSDDASEGVPDGSANQRAATISSTNDERAPEADTGQADAPEATALAGSASAIEDTPAATVATSTAPAAPADGRANSDALAEAEDLLDRLRALLPSLTSSPSDESSVDTSGIADQLQQAIDQNAKPEFDDLRGVLEAAQARPRDVDTMLNLVAKIDPMLALLHAHGNLLNTMSTTVTQLRGENGGQ